VSKVKISLKPAPDDAKVNDPRFQEELNEFSKSLRAAGVFYSQRGMFFDTVGAVGYSLPEFVLILSQTIFPRLGSIMVMWLNGRSGRKISVKIGDVEAEAQTDQDVGNVLEKVKEFSARETVYS
jgi:hypothetical protein